eukprot:CAMPEP_0116872860 /NCGR_PEP_ID=MMETSP0463-20121206/3773_1 /TAXON_ID=181622 /ORGANISM="Strombidinopsis sp, Strain SopsisLIS2011" /LENGTH=58 /DNA_ID=CAMNT_0004513829 /DNA_START=553 /DNA_END=729 /DNA_ORIENTATION=+
MGEEGHIGDFAPLLVMHPKKKEQVKKDNALIDKRLAEAFRRMGMGSGSGPKTQPKTPI